ncbi:MAG: DUF362 domain-containing protein [Anaerolineae bacterium]|nr:DUF362 domain-containing protein [Anaerolineae bacterium]
MSEKSHKKFSRRVFLRRTLTLSSATLLQWITGCSYPSQPTERILKSPPPVVTSTGGPEKIASYSPPTATPAPPATPTRTPTHTPIPDGILFDAAQLTQVGVAHQPDINGYPETPPYHPDTLYPEYPFGNQALSSSNAAYGLVRQALQLLHPLDSGTPDWNPLQTYIKPGNRVLIKPNLVDASAWQNGQMTHPAILRPIIDFAYKACGPQGSIMVGDAPWSIDVFYPLVQKTGIQTLIDWYAAFTDVPVQLVDMNTADEQDTPLVNLGQFSAFDSIKRTWFDGHGNPMLADSKPGIGRYRISHYVLDADVVISVPKAKVHCSGGITVAMKNAVGIIPAWDGMVNDGVLKDCPHTSNIDQAAGKRGMYLDNDTIWRSMADLNRIMRYAGRNGILQASPQRRLLTIVDAIIAAEASQYDPVPFPLNTIVIGSDPIAVDAVTARCMGFDWRQLKSVVKAALNPELPLGVSSPDKIDIKTNIINLCDSYQQALQPESFIYSWQGHLELQDFSAPEIVSCNLLANHKLEIHVRDLSSVSWVRVAFEYAGEIKVKSLNLHSGDLRDGIWQTDFPHHAVIADLTITASDVLFNESRHIFHM